MARVQIDDLPSGNSTPSQPFARVFGGMENVPQAARADRFALYQRALPYTPRDIETVRSYYREIQGTQPTILREDFCGTFQCSTLWVQHHPNHRAWAVDCDETPLQWGRRHHLRSLPESRRDDLRIYPSDVRSVNTPEADLVVALNYAVGLFDTRFALRDYIRNVKTHLTSAGLFVFDVFGGDRMQTSWQQSRTLSDGTRYVFTNAGTQHGGHSTQCAIHFVFGDGSRLHNAFTYRWRLWSLDTLDGILAEAGMKRRRMLVHTPESEKLQHRHQIPRTPQWYARILAQPR